MRASKLFSSAAAMVVLMCASSALAEEAAPAKAPAAEEPAAQAPAKAPADAPAKAPEAVEPAPAAATAPAAVAAEPATVAKEADESGKKNPWRDSEIAYEHGFSALSLKKDAEPTYNPYYAHRLSLAPQWHVSDYVVLKGRLDLEQELTNADDTTYKHEILLGDLMLDLATPGLKEPTTGIRVSGYLRLMLPTSKAAHAATLNFGVAPAMTVSRKFEVPLIKSITLAYFGRFQVNSHDYTTAQGDARPILACRDSASPACVGSESFGYRNPWGALAHGPRLSFELTEKLGLDLAHTFISSYLYGLADDGKYLGDDLDVSTRHAQWFMAGLSYGLLDYLGVSLSASTMYGDLKPDGKYRTPFFNRFTQMSLGFSLLIDPLIQKLQ